MRKRWFKNQELDFRRVSGVYLFSCSYCMLVILNYIHKLDLPMINSNIRFLKSVYHCVVE